MEAFDTQPLFAQLAALPGSQGVKAVIENHDAWSHGTAIAALPGLWARLAAIPLAPAVEARIAAQRRALQSLVTPLPRRYASAG